MRDLVAAMRRLIASALLAGTLGGVALAAAPAAGAVEITVTKPICTILALKESQARDEAEYWAQKAKEAREDGDLGAALGYFGQSATYLRQANTIHQQYLNAGC